MLLTMQFTLSLYLSKLLHSAPFVLISFHQDGQSEDQTHSDRLHVVGQLMIQQQQQQQHTGYRSIDQMIDHRMLQFVWRVDLWLLSAPHITTSSSINHSSPKWA